MGLSSQTADDYVAASLAPRTLETAIATGFAVDDLLDLGGDLWEPAQSELAHRASRDDPELYLRYLELMRSDGALDALGRRQAELWQRVVLHVPDGAQALLVSHSTHIQPLVGFMSLSTRRPGVGGERHR